MRSPGAGAGDGFLLQAAKAPQHAIISKARQAIDVYDTWMAVARASVWVLLALVIFTAEAAAQIRARALASGFMLPVAVIQDPVDRTLQYVVEQAGRIRIVRSGTVLANDFLNLTPLVASRGEQGLLGLAFAPDFATSGRLYVNFTNTSGDTVVARFRRAGDGLVV